MWTWVGLTIAALLVVGVGLWLALLVSLRSKWGPGLTLIRRMNRRFTNPRVVRSAGGPGASASLIHHVGRSSGRSYRTPIGVIDTDDRFVIALPYGTSPDWLRNVQAAGAAVIDTDGRTYRVADPRVVAAADVNRLYSRRERWTHRIYGVDEFLVLTRVAADVPAGLHLRNQR